MPNDMMKEFSLRKSDLVKTAICCHQIAFVVE